MDSPVINYNHSKDISNAYEGYNIEATVLSDVGIAPGGMRVHYSVDGREYQAIAMDSVGDATYQVYIPKQRPGTEVSYYLEAVDVKGHSTLSKTYAPLEHYEYQVDLDIGLSALDTALMYLMILIVFGIIWGGFAKSMHLAIMAEKRKNAGDVA